MDTHCRYRINVGRLSMVLCIFMFGCAPAPDKKSDVSDRTGKEPAAMSPDLEISNGPGAVRAAPEPESGFSGAEFESEFEAFPDSFGGDSEPELSPSDEATAAPIAIRATPPRAEIRQPRSLSASEDIAPRNFRSETIPLEMAADEVEPPLESISPPVTTHATALAVPKSASEQPATQTKINVFYATDRKSSFGISSGDWIKVHFAAIAVGLIYLIAFLSVLLSSRKITSGIVAFVALAGFLVLGQSATVRWQQLKRLAENNDAVYLPEIRTGFDEPLEYGTCEVTIPPNHVVGHVDSPSIFKLEFSENPQKHVVLNRVVPTAKDAFYDSLVETIDQSAVRQAMVFIHGYNVGFDDAVKRTAQIAHDLKFDGAPICYSWASHGALSNYTMDMANADATVVPLQRFLEETVRRTGSTTIHLVAHSMGNRALLQALDRIAVGNPNTPKLFGQLVMAAPDVSAHDFRHRFAQSALQLADSVTLYASSRDRALLAATEIHGHNRAGLAGEHLIVIDGMDTIDVSEIDTSLIGHNYYGDHPELIKDLQALVELAQPASKRNWLTRLISPSGFGYFRFLEAQRRSAGDNRIIFD